MAREMSAKSRRANHKHHEEFLASQREKGWQFSEEYRGAGLPLVPGRRFRVKAHKPGWYKFRKHVINPEGTEHIECHGPYTKKGVLKRGSGFHAFDPASILQVERKLQDPIDERKTRKEAELSE